MANLVGFRASILNGMLRPTNFEVELTFPGFVQNGAAATALGRFHCKGTEVPPSTISPIPVFFQGRQINVAGEREFQPWTVRIYNDNFLIRNALEAWSNGINNISNNTGVIQPSLYQTDLRVTHLDRNGNVAKQIKVIDAFPIQVGPIELDYEASNVVEVFDCVFAYNFYESSGVNA